MTDDLKRLLNSPFFEDLKDETVTIEEKVEAKENDVDQLQAQLHRDRNKLFEAEARGDMQKAQHYDRLASRREKSLEKEKAALRKLHQEQDAIVDRVENRRQKMINAAREMVAQHDG